MTDSSRTSRVNIDPTKAAPIPEPDQLEVSRVMAMLGRRGGSKTSEAKTAAVRENGKKGGRPQKTRAAIQKGVPLS